MSARAMSRLRTGLPAQAPIVVEFGHGVAIDTPKGIARTGVTELTVAVMPWRVGLLIFLVVVTSWPGLSLWLPRQLGTM